MPEHTPAPTPSRAVYGFALHLTFKTLFVIYLLWAVIPENYFRSIGITYLPQRYWAITIPIFLLTLLALFAFVIYPSLGLMMNPNADSLKTVTDKAAVLHRKEFEVTENRAKFDCVCTDVGNCEKHLFEAIKSEEFIENCVPAVQDLSMLEVSRHLYLK